MILTEDDLSQMVSTTTPNLLKGPSKIHFNVYLIGCIETKMHLGKYSDMPCEFQIKGGGRVIFTSTKYDRRNSAHTLELILQLLHNCVTGCVFSKF